LAIEKTSTGRLRADLAGQEKLPARQTEERSLASKSALLYNVNGAVVRFWTKEIAGSHR
jgi:hypothetical protein